MPDSEAYFNIPLPNKAGLVEMQDYLKKHLPDGAQYSDPAQFHITLLYAEDVGAVDLRGIDWPRTLPIFGISGQYLEVWDTADGQAVVLRVNGGPQLRALQTVLFYEAWSRGVTISQFSYPQDWRAHITLATLPPDTLFGLDLYLTATFATQVGRFVLTGPGYAELAQFELSTVGPGGQMLSEKRVRADAIREQLRGADGRYRVRDRVAVTEFRGMVGVDFPDVPVSEAVDVEALTKGDAEPFFVTLKIAQAGVTSGNGIFYGPEEARAIMRQTVEKRPTGGRGHLRDDELSSALPANPLHWIGAVQQDEFVWGKAYAAPSETRDWLRRLGATRSEVATSIFGYADELTWDEEREAFRMGGFVLEYIDLASPERAGVPSLAVVPLITSEMAGATPATDESEKPMDKLEIIRQMTADDVKLLPEAVVNAVIAQSEQAKTLSNLQQMVGELRSLLGLDDKANVVEHVKALHTQVTEQAKVAVAAKIAELVNDAVKVESVRAIVLELVQAQKPEAVDAVQAAVDNVLARESVKLLLKSAVVETSGPPQRRPAVPTGDGEAVDKFFPKAAEPEA